MDVKYAVFDWLLIMTEAWARQKCFHMDVDITLSYVLLRFQNLSFTAIVVRKGQDKPSNRIMAKETRYSKTSLMLYKILTVIVLTLGKFWFSFYSICGKSGHMKSIQTILINHLNCSQTPNNDTQLFKWISFRTSTSGL